MRMDPGRLAHWMAWPGPEPRWPALGFEHAWLSDIIGTPGDDSLTGSEGDDRIDGRKGADTMVGGAGNDLYIVDNIGDVVRELAGEGVDSVEARVSYTLAAAVEHLILTGSGDLNGTGNELDNLVVGNKGSNRLDGAAGNDTLSGHRGDDSLYGGAGADALDGGIGDDFLNGGRGADTMLGGFGDDMFLVDNKSDEVIEGAGAGTDTVRASVSYTLAAGAENLVLLGSSGLTGRGNELDNRIDGNDGANLLEGGLGRDTLVGHKGNDSLNGGTGDDQLDGSTGDDQLDGGDGDDQLDGGEGVDHMVGGTGNDSYLVDSLSDVIVEQTGGGIDTVKSNVSWNLGSDTENLILTNDVEDTKGFGNSLANYIQGTTRQNIIDGGAGNDTIVGVSNDSAFSADRLFGRDGDDSITGGGRLSTDTLDGGLGNDTLQVLADGHAFGQAGDDLLISGIGDGYRTSVTELDGGSGNDTLRSGAEMYGGEDNDLLEVDLAHMADGGSGNDTIRGTATASWITVVAGDGDDVVQMHAWGIAGMTVSGGAGADILSIDGDSGVSVDGGVGDDVIDLSINDDGYRVQGGDGNDQVHATGKADGTIDGGNGNDWLEIQTGSGKSDLQLSGGEGKDTLVASHGDITGGGDKDTFLLGESHPWSAAGYRVIDFVLDEDRLAIRQQSLPVGDGDDEVEGATVIHAPGGFDASAELVINVQEIVGSLTIDAFAAAFGNADQAYAEGQTAVLVAGNGSETWVAYFQSSGNDAAITPDELTIMATLANGAIPLVGDIEFFP